MSKLYLPTVTPRNEAARRLAWWIVNPGADETTYHRLGQLHRIDVTVGVLDRLLGGELVPGASLAWRISQITDGAVRVADWRDDAAGAWADRPAERVPAQIAA